ncbi:type I polyketide synthase [Paenibacillus caseinilyticus]|nr:beta-ketoacyl synthase N-terminal-like domain-containing protein [Paenibacillus caseinilyticus]MCZ8522695.1 beta-ketoacyl synthase N-terminal-like domain-containing protein [Paenibacillus caseinilyticus]
MEETGRLERTAAAPGMEPAPGNKNGRGPRDRKTAAAEAIAIIGMSGQFPKADTLEQFWINLKEGRDCISEVPPSRWDMSFYDADPNTPLKSYSKWMGVLEEADRFDPHFFQISPAEAELMDPQQRLFLEHCWRALEDAGIRTSDVAGSRCGVFAGCSANGYEQLMGEEGLSAYGLVGRSIAILPARISYLLNLKGPSMAIDTSCSASLVAMAEACNSLALGDSDLALAGGVCVLTNPDMHIMTSKAGMLSPDGRCFTFDNRANGFVPGEGVGVVLLKRLSDAERDGDLIHGVICGWGMNQDGRTNGITAPSGQSQLELERDIYERFGIHPETITMVEAHGTGTRLGDPIEVEALTDSFRHYTEKAGYCALGSVKSNIGHLLTAAGAAGVIKVLLSMQHNMLPPTIHFQKLNDHISLENSPFYINSTLRTWAAPSDGRRRAAVSSFGFSGTNAHLVLEQYVPSGNLSFPEGAGITAEAYGFIFPLSAPDADGLKRYARKLRDWLEGSEVFHDTGKLQSLAYSLQNSREPMRERVAVLAADAAGLLQGLRHYLEGQLSPCLVTGAETTEPSGWQSGPLRLGGLPEAAAGELRRLACRWAGGDTVHWQEGYSNRPERVRLPAFPLNKERYWVRKPAIVPSPAPQAASHSGRSADPRSYVYGLLALHNLGPGPDESEGSFDEEMPFSQMGIDSLVAIHVRNTIIKDYGIEITMGQLMDGLHTQELIRLLQRGGSAPEPLAAVPSVAAGNKERQWLEL